MEIEFDLAKNVKNRKDHRLPLEKAADLDWDAALVWLDDRFDYDEERMSALVPEADTLYYVAFVYRGKARRVISLRYATNPEKQHYVRTFFDAS
ncbi:MAG: BrnT family toxin [Azoarcus sp.]|jgi:uncharacterized DUF497 family protein|nr:BrnT family toxin [Azoarcus sp.]